MKKNNEKGLLRTIRLTKGLSIRSLRLIESQTKLGEIKKGKLPGHANQGLIIAINIDESKQTACTKVKLEVAARYDEDPETKPAVSIGATFKVIHALDKIPVARQMGDAIARVSVMQVWPYWREFVSSMSVRMGLPPLPVPVMNVFDLPKAQRVTKAEFKEKADAPALPIESNGHSSAK